MNKSVISFTDAVHRNYDDPKAHFQVYGSEVIATVSRDVFNFGPHVNYIPHISISEENRVNIHTLDNANALLNNKSRQYFDHAAKRNNNFKSSSIYSKIVVEKGNDQEVKSALSLQQVIDHLKFISKQRRKPLKIDPYASRLLGLPNYCDYLSAKNIESISIKTSRNKFQKK